jgi:hypothetical protein
MKMSASARALSFFKGTSQATLSGTPCMLFYHGSLDGSAVGSTTANCMFTCSAPLCATCIYRPLLIEVHFDMYIFLL